MRQRNKFPIDCFSDGSRTRSGSWIRAARKAALGPNLSAKQLFQRFICGYERRLRVAAPAEGGIFLQAGQSREISQMGFQAQHTGITSFIQLREDFEQMAVALAGVRSRAMSTQRSRQAALVVLSVLICMSTVFLKQHSVVDVVCGVALSLGLDMVLRRSSVGMGIFRAAVPRKNTAMES